MRIQSTNKAGQTWSTDVLFAASLFVLGFAVFFYVLHLSSSSTSTESLIAQGNMISLKFVSGEADNSSLFFIDQNMVDIERLKGVSNLSYKELKSILGVINDFCIYFEDEEEKLINLSSFTGLNSVGIGSPNISVSGMRCGTTA